MIQFLRQKSPTLVFIVLISGMVLLMSHDVGTRGGKDFAGEILFKAGAPAVHAGSSATGFASDVFKDYVDLRDARREGQRLADELLRTQMERDRLREQAAATERLQALLDLRRSLAPASTAARVVGSGFAGGSDTLLIDRGSSDGVAVGQPVMALGGVVGRVVMVSPTLAKVHCLTGEESGIGVLLQASGFQGVVIGKNRGLAELLYLPTYVEVAHGDLLVTSGLDRIYPPGLPVGRIVGKPTGEGVSRRFEVRALVDFARISEVLVLKVVPGGDEPGSSPSPSGRAAPKALHR